MIYVSIEEPVPQKIGDIWFDVGTKITSRVQILHSRLSATSNQLTTLVWTPIIGATNPGVPASIGDVVIGPYLIPSIWDGSSWIPAVSGNYMFPPQIPTLGDTWIDSMTNVPYVYIHKWVKLISNHPTAQPTITGQNISLSPKINPGIVPSVNSGGLVSPQAISSQNSVLMQQTSQYVLEIFGPNPQSMVTIDTQKFTITYGPSYHPDAAAKIFWEALAGNSPKQLEEQVKIRDEIIDELVVILRKYEAAGFTLPTPTTPIDPIDAWDAAMGVIK
jgi:hypothetical protein